jgi:DNA-binding transcriptional ArsR family regulator
MISDDSAVELAEVFRLLGDPSRLRIVFACLERPVCVGEIAGTVGLSPSLVSHHLRLLRATRVLKAERQGRHVYYSAADDHIRCVLKDMSAHMEEPPRPET